MAESRGYSLLKNSTGADPSDLAMYARLYPAESLATRSFYNIGAGQFRHPYWTNIEKKSDWYTGVAEGKYIEHDLLSLKKLPVGDNSAEAVYSSHTVEHITDPAAQMMFDEAYRILKPGGTLRFATPDMDLVYAAYRRSDRDFFYWIDRFSIPDEYKKIYTKPLNEASLEQIFLSYFASHASKLSPYSGLTKIGDEELRKIFKEKSLDEALNYCTSRYSPEVHLKYPGPHVNWWTFNKAKEMLEQSGFRNITKSGYGQSACPVLRNISLFDGTHPKISLYVEAVKNI